MNNKKYLNSEDSELLDLFYSEKENEIIGVLLERYTLLLFGICMKYLKNETNAKDAVQQIFLKTLKELPKYKVTYFKSWIYMVAKNHCLMQLRNQHKIVELNNEYYIESHSTEIDIFLNKELEYSNLEICISELNNEQRICVTLFYLKKKSYAEIVETTDFSLLQVKSNIQNGKRNLKILMEKKRNHKNEQA